MAQDSHTQYLPLYLLLLSKCYLVLDDRGTQCLTARLFDSRNNPNQILYYFHNILNLCFYIFKNNLNNTVLNCIIMIYVFNFS